MKSELNNLSKSECELNEHSNENWFTVSGDLDDFIFFNDEHKYESER